MNSYLLRLGFDEIVLNSTQNASIGDVQIVSHGTGVRSVLPIVAALTSPDIKFLLVDEPELALEARSQKILKELFYEAVGQGKQIVVASQSHIFLNKRQYENNNVVEINEGVSSVRPVKSQQELLDITYNLLGNSLEDLFSPSNFLIVEGSSDQVVCEKVAQLLGVPSAKVKIISARGIDNIQDSFKAIRNTLVPLVAGESPYSKRVVVLADKPPKQSASSFKTLKSQLKERVFLLRESSIEDHLPDALYLSAGTTKSDVLRQLSELKKALKYGDKGEALKQLNDYKKRVSNSIASILSYDDLKLLPTIVGAIKLAAKMAET